MYTEHTPVQRRLSIGTFLLIEGLYQGLLNAVWRRLCSVPSAQFTFGIIVHRAYSCTASTFHRNLPLQWGVLRAPQCPNYPACQQFGVGCVQSHLPSSPLVSYTEHTPVQRQLFIGTQKRRSSFDYSSINPNTYLHNDMIVCTLTADDTIYSQSSSKNVFSYRVVWRNRQFWPPGMPSIYELRP